MTIEEYFLQYTKELAYLEMKEEWEAESHWFGRLGLDPIPLPIITSDFTEGIQSGAFDEQLDFKYFVRGMIWNLGIDPDFQYAEAYQQILQSLVKEPWRFALQMGMDVLAGEEGAMTRLEKENESSGTQDPAQAAAALADQEKEKLAHALIAFRAARQLAPDQAQALVPYGSFLWQVEAGKDSESFVQEASKTLERALALDPEAVQAYVALGSLNSQLGHYLKAKAYYDHGLAVAQDERQREEIRRLTAAIADEAAIEDAIAYIHRADYGHAIQALMAAKKDSSRYDVDYYLGLCYENIGNFEAAVEAFLSAREKGGTFGSLYNDLVYSLNAVGRPEEALAYAKEGLDEEPSNIRLRYNRAVIEASLGLLEEAREDCDFLLEYADLSEDMVNLCLQLKEQLDQ